jgi:hypothetical protein
MTPFLVIADMDDGTFAVLAVDPTKRIGTGCSGIVQSVHQQREEAEKALACARGAS